ncbi:sensor histidine kinase [Paenibacillus massiliensis]|uniref:sensor histidine kinase n=1 Tax=Paenibacillus massiliensis TaxID=225917 RepID=UPI000375B767|nr:sensor histidine kinase [Paenibacillus massiliensis]
MRIHWFKIRKLQPTLLIMLSLLVLILMTLISIVVYYSTSRLISSKLSEYSLSELEQMNYQVNQRMTSIRSAALSIVINPEVISILQHSKGSDIYQQIRNNEIATRILSNAAYSRNDISEIMIVTDRMDIYNYSNPNGFYELSRAVEKNFWSYVESRKEGFIPPRSNDMRSDGTGTKIITYFHEITKGETRLGYVFINLHFSSLNDLSGLRSSNGDLIYFADENNEIYDTSGAKLSDRATHDIVTSFADQKKGYTLTYLGNHKYLSVFSSPNDFNWRIIRFKPYGDVVEGMPALFTRLLLVAACCFVLAVTGAVLFSQSVTQPLKRLIRQMNKVGHGNFNIELDSEYTNEIGQLNEKFLIMSSKIRELMADSEREQKQLREMELRALQSQINPHFLYNTLDAINWMAIRHQAPEISKMTANLGKIFRLSLNKGRELTSVSAELAHLDAYIHIMRHKYQDRFHYVQHVDPSMLTCETIKIILQPLVENCFVHGLSSNKGAGLIELKGIYCGDDLIFHIKDDGVGVNPEMLNEALKQGLGSVGYGIHNVNERIGLHYGQSYGLSYLDVERGTLAQIRLPRRLFQQMEEDTH